MAIDFYGVQVTQTKRVTGEPETELLSISKVIEQIKNGTCYNGYYTQDLRPLCKQLAELTRTGQTDQYRLEKRKLPAYYFGCVCSGNNGKNIHRATGLLIADFDHFGTDENPDTLTNYRQMLQRDKYTAVLFQSPSRQGLKVLVKINISTADDQKPDKLKETYTNYFLALQNYYKGLGLTMDGSGKNINRACFFSWDNDIFVNENSKVWDRMADKEPAPMGDHPTTQTPTPTQTQKPAPTPTRDTNDYYYSVANFEEFIKEMRLQGVHICDNYGDWVKVCFALGKTFDPTTGGYYFDQISQINDKYDPTEVTKQWNICTAKNDGRTGIEFIFNKAKENGLRVPESAKRPQRVQTPTAEETSPQTAENKPKKKQAKEPTPPPADIPEENRAQWDSSNPVKCAKIWVDGKYKIRYNEITGNSEYKEKRGGKWERLEDNFVSYVWEQLHTRYNVKISYNETDKLFRSYAKDNTYNPITDFINSLPDFDLTTGQSPINDYFSMLDNATEKDLLLCKKWFCQLLTIATRDNFRPQTALILQGGQGVHKTEFLRHLIPPQLSEDYFINRPRLTMHEKDQQEDILKKWLIQCDEFETVVRNPDKNAIWKGLVTHNNYVDFRAVGKTYHIKGKAYGIFCATTNETDIYCDNENRRNLTMFLNSDLNIQKILKFDVLPMYAEAKAIIKQNPDFAYTTRDDEKYITDKAKMLRAQSNEELYFYEYFNVVPDPDTDEQTARFILSAKQIYNILDYYEAEATGTHITNKITVGSLGLMLSKFAQHNKGRANVTYYTVYTHARYITKMLNYCSEMGGVYREENTFSKPYYHYRDTEPYERWKQRQEQEKQQGKTISLFDTLTPEEQARIEEKKQQSTAPTPADDTGGFNPENIMLEAIKKKMGGGQ